MTETTVNGKIVKGLGGLYTVRTVSEGTVRLFSCRAKGAFRHEDEKVTVGDEVVLRYDESAPEETAVIREILPRKNILIRPPLANLDILFSVIAAARPAPVTETLDKLLAIAEHNGIEPVLIVTKSDCDPAAAEHYTALYRQAGFTVFPLSGAAGVGVEPLRAYIAEHVHDGRCAAFAGASGVGKSTLMNCLFPGLALATNAVSARIERGRHTTRHVELFPTTDTPDCGFLADTPGFSMLDFMRFDFLSLDDLFDAFRDFAPYRGACRYPDCTHTGEGAAECAIARAVRDGRIAPTRHESYKSLYRTLKIKKNTY